MKKVLCWVLMGLMLSGMLGALAEETISYPYPEHAAIYDALEAGCKEEKFITEKSDYTIVERDDGVTAERALLAGANIRINYTNDGFLSYQLTFDPNTYGSGKIETLIPLFIRTIDTSIGEKLAAIELTEYLMKSLSPMEGMTYVSTSSYETDDFRIVLTEMKEINFIGIVMLPL